MDVDVTGTKQLRQPVDGSVVDARGGGALRHAAHHTQPAMQWNRMRPCTQYWRRACGLGAGVLRKSSGATPLLTPLASSLLGPPFLAAAAVVWRTSAGNRGDFPRSADWSAPQLHNNYPAPTAAAAAHTATKHSSDGACLLECLAWIGSSGVVAGAPNVVAVQGTRQPRPSDHTAATSSPTAAARTRYRRYTAAHTTPITHPPHPYYARRMSSAPTALLTCSSSARWSRKTARRRSSAFVVTSLRASTSCSAVA